jgi:hypothetical protein
LARTERVDAKGRPLYVAVSGNGRKIGLLGAYGAGRAEEYRAAVEARRAALAVGPLVSGVATSEAWRDPDPRSGWVRPVTPDPRAGHLLCQMAQISDSGNVFEPFINSWGSGWGRAGYGMLNAEYMTYCNFGPSIQWRVPRDWWTRARVWEYIIAHK